MRPASALLACSWLLAAGTLHAQEADAARWTVTGTVVDADGRPIAGTGVVGDDQPELRLDSALDHPQVRTDRVGRFELVTLVRRDRQPDFGLLIAAAGRIGLLVTGFPGHLEGDAGARHFALGTVTLYRAATLVGSVLDPAGQPVAFVRVRAEDLAHTRVLLPEAPQLRGNWTSDTVSDAHGTFRLRSVPPTALTLHCRCAGYYDLDQRPVLAGETPRLTLRPSGWVSGQLSAADGRPLAAMVELVAIGGADGPIAATGADGSFRLSLSTRGAFTVRTRPWHDAVPPVASPPLTGPQRDLQLRHDPRTGAVALVAARHRGSGAPLPGARIAVHYGSGGSFDPWSRTSDWLPMPGIADGEPIAVPPSPRGERAALVRVSAPGFASRVVRAAGALNGSPPLLVAELEPESTIAGQVVMERNHSGPVQVWVQPRYGSDRGIDWTPPAWAVTADAQGRFVLRGLQPGCYRVHATGPHIIAAAELCELQPGRACAGVRLQPPPELLAGELDVSTAPINPERYVVRASHARDSADAACLLAAVSGTGTFAVPVASTATCLELLCPGPDHLSSTLHARLGHPRLEFAGLDAICDPGELRGSIALQQVHGDLRRLVAVATGNEQVRLGQVDAGGRFRLLLASGTWEIELVDLASGWLVHRAAAAVHVRAHEPQELALQPQLREVTVAVLGDLAALSQPSLQASACSGDRRRLDQRSKSRLLCSGLPLDPGQPQVTLLLPQEAHELVLTSGVARDERQLDSVRVAAGSEPLAVRLVAGAMAAAGR